MNNKGKIAITQIMILVIGIIAFAWMIGSFGSVSADDPVENGGEEDPLCIGIHGTCVAVGECSGTTNFDARCLNPDTPVCCRGDSNGNGFGEVVEIGGGVLTAAIVKGIVDKAKEGAREKVKKTGFSKWLEKQKLFKGETAGSQIFLNALWAVATATIITSLAKLYASERNLADIGLVTWVGAGAGIAATTVWALLAAESAAGPPGWIAAAVTAFFYGVYMLVGYKIYSRETFTFYPGLWQPPVGGDDCQKCNNLKLPDGESACSEYICHSYGQACDWINDETEYETCIETNVNDNSPPIITPLETAYGENVFPEEGMYEYSISDAGAKIIYNGEGGTCIPAFTSIILAVETNEEAHCKISLEPMEGTRDEVFEQMMAMNEGTINTKEHTLTLPTSVTASSSALETAGYTLRNGGNFEFYIRCRDVQGNINNIDYITDFCVQQGPDTWAPEITGTSPEKDSFVKHETLTINPFQVYTNEPVDCKWDFGKKSYSAMAYEFDECSQDINNPIRGLYTLGCKGELTGFKDGVVNKYYITCLDQPELKGTDDENKRNEMDAYEMTLTGTDTLVIQDVKINGEENGTVMRDSRTHINVKIEVETFGGAEEGKARCRYSDDLGETKNYALFSNEGSRDYLVKNTHNLYLEEGIYEYFIKCEDIANNPDTTFITFEVETDTEPPIIVRAFKEDTYLKIITNEPAECVYVDFGCIYLYEDGIPMTTFEEVEHYTDWNIETDFYIKCKDQYGKGPDTDDCSLIARPFEIFEPLE